MTQIRTATSERHYQYDPQGQILGRYEFTPSSQQQINIEQIGDDYRRVSTTEGGQTTVEHRFYINQIALVTLNETTPDQPGTSDTHYLIHDYQGSVIAITNDSGQAEHHYRYSPFGQQQRIGLELTSLSQSLSQPLYPGYTGHQTLESMDLVHMQGRVYDPSIGRMLQPDPIIQRPSHILSHHRYAYVWNNPMSLTDPTGYTGEGSDELTQDTNRRNASDDNDDSFQRSDSGSSQSDQTVGKPAAIESQESQESTAESRLGESWQ